MFLLKLPIRVRNGPRVFLEGRHLPMSSVPDVVVEPSAYHAMLVQAYLDLDKEVCGLLFGQLEPGSVRVLGHLPSEATKKDPTSWAKALELGKTRKIQLSAFMTSNRRQAVNLNVQIRPAMKASTALRHRLATSSLVEIMRLSSSGTSERLSQLCQDAKLASINLVINECQRWNASVSGAIVENVDFVKQAFDLGLV